MIDLVNAPFTLWLAGVLGIQPGLIVALGTAIVLLSLIPLVYFMVWLLYALAGAWQRSNLIGKIVLGVPIALIFLFLLATYTISTILVIIGLVTVAGALKDWIKS